MAGNIAVDSVVAFWLELIVSHPAEAGVAGVQGRRFLVQKRIGDVEHQAVGETMFKLSLKCIGLRMAVVSETYDEISQSREAVALSVGIRNTAISVVERIAKARWVAVVIHHVAAKWHVARFKFIQIFSRDQALHQGP